MLAVPVGRGRFPAGLVSLALILAAALLFTASAAANHIAGATYDGTHSGGGTVHMTISADGSTVTLFSFTNLPGDKCTFTSGSITANIPITNHAFSYSTVTGSFPGIQTAAGTLHVNLGSICNSQTVTWDARTTSPPVADVSVVVSDAPDPALVGANLTYTTTVSNAGPSDVDGVTLNQTFAGATLVSAAAGQGSCGPAANGVSCNLGIVRNGTGVPVTIVVTPSQPGQLTSSANVTSGGQDPNLGNNTATAETTVLPPCIVPNVKGKALAAAKQAIARANCRTGKVTRKFSKKVKKGRVVSQSPAPRTRLPNAGKVNLGVSRGPKP